MTTEKSPGQLAYEADCRARPSYYDGTRRRRWDQLHEIARQSWEKGPKPAQEPPARPLHTLEAHQHGNSIVLTYAHRPPTPLDLRHMTELLRRTADQCEAEAQRIDPSLAGRLTRDERA